MNRVYRPDQFSSGFAVIAKKQNSFPGKQDRCEKCEFIVRRNDVTWRCAASVEPCLSRWPVTSAVITASQGHNDFASNGRLYHSLSRRFFLFLWPVRRGAADVLQSGHFCTANSITYALFFIITNMVQFVIKARILCVKDLSLHLIEIFSWILNRTNLKSWTEKM